MLSQFVLDKHNRTLSDLDYDFPEFIHAIGRLDNISEGLLILTNNRNLTKFILKKNPLHERKYAVQVQGLIDDTLLNRMQNGLEITIEGGEKWFTSPCKVEIIDSLSDQYPAAILIPPQAPTTWLLITLSEGKFRQVRKMCKAIHRKCLRLIRIGIENIKLENLPSGSIQSFTEEEFFQLMKLDS
jgi:23S rRNA pseudouridine2457 synthase